MTVLRVKTVFKCKGFLWLCKGDFPGIGIGSAESSFLGNSEAFAKLDATYLGGSSSEFGFGIALDGCDHAYVGGFTSSADYPGVGRELQTARSTWKRHWRLN
ncbi:MAG: hypothetical protein P8X96_20750 [Desulfobacteraceae bacterium]